MNIHIIFSWTEYIYISAYTCFVLPVLISAARMSVELTAVTRVLKALMRSVAQLLVVREYKNLYPQQESTDCSIK